ncbi:MAG: efflux RND transporter periplasmic adaptor subunit [Verrucomicrobia bacterium]|nr:efflux RND transporter periplasmic adaptor subunit [Verrucomicrobiota bacterium]MBI3871192.1 efflux RND transporter periplasmic adaptor subunit [Verrucomicrobiota bacterium]
MIAGVAFCELGCSDHSGSPPVGQKPGMAPGGKAELPPVPVVPGVVLEKDVPVYLEGLGTVQAFQTVTIRPRVDGQIRRIAFVEGQEVHEGDLLAEIDPDPYRALVDQAAAKKAQDEALLANSRVDLKRYASLLAEEGVTQQAYDTQSALVKQLEAAVKADEAAVSSARVQFAYTSITSPIGGRVGIRQVDQGNIVRANDQTGIVVVTQIKPISVVFTLPEQTLSKIRGEAGDTPFTILAVDRDNMTPLAEGKLSVIDNQIDTTTGTLRLKATFPNQDLRLWPGQFVNARLLLTVRRKSPVVPAAVIQRGPEGAFVFVIKEDQTVDLRPVKVGPVEQGEALIEEGLRPGEKVVVDGQYKLQRGSRIRPAEAPAPAGAPGPRSSAGAAMPGKPGP